MSDAKRYKAALVSQYSDVVLAIDHDAALAAKDARIAEFEGLLEHVQEGAEILQSLIDNIDAKGNYSAESTVNFLRQAHSCLLPAFSGQQQAEPECKKCDGSGDVHGLDGEWRGYCDCAAGVALRGSKPATPSEDGRDWPEDFAHENGNYMNRCHSCEQTFIGHKRRVTCKACASAPREDHGNATIGSLERLVAQPARQQSEDGGEVPATEDALTALGLGYQLSKEEAVHLYYVGLRSPVITVLEVWEAIGHDIGCNPTKEELLASLQHMAEQCAAQPARQVGVTCGHAACKSLGEPHPFCDFVKQMDARQVGGDEQAAFCSWLVRDFPDTYTDADGRHAWEHSHVSALAWQARAALAPAAVVMPSDDRLMKIVIDKYYNEPSPFMRGSTNWCAWMGKAVLDEVARLNRRAIPVGLIKQAAYFLEAHSSGQSIERQIADELRALLGKDEGGE